jgi:hypothetical protein
MVDPPGCSNTSNYFQVPTTSNRPDEYFTRLLYTLGRLDKLNFPLSEAEQAELDALGVGGVEAAFRKAGCYSMRPSGFYGVQKRGKIWIGEVCCLIHNLCLHHQQIR